MLTHLEQTIRDYLPHIIHMSLATCQDNKPRISEVHFVYDRDLNLYFRSKPSRRHSQEIAQNLSVAGSIVTQHVVDEKPRGIYFEWKAEIVIIDKYDEICTMFCERVGCDTSIIDEQHKEDGHKFYKISISDYYIFDKKESNPSTKYHLSWWK